MTPQLLELLQRRLAETAIGASTLRNQGNSGVVARARRHLGTVDLRRFAVKRDTSFHAALNDQTEALRRAFPSRAKHWGTARKALNIFLRDALYNRYLSQHYGLEALESWLEVPLDRDVADGIAQSYIGRLPRWPGVKHLRPPASSVFQQAAQQIATAAGIARVHLDIYWWRKLARGLFP
jgi:hypothetical protein